MRRNSIYLSGALLFIAAATVPWDFQDHPHWYKVAWLPFVTGIVRPLDLLLNAALYFPIGFLIPLRSRRRHLFLAAVVALFVSTLLELTQVWSHARFPSTTDLAMNVIGSIAGAVVAMRDVPPA